MPRKRHKNKRYSPELKIAVVEAYLSGKGSMAELAKKWLYVNSWGRDKTQIIGLCRRETLRHDFYV